MKISIAMTTYNGSKHIEEQLLSILHQTRQPDEVVICDDRSVDDTVDIVNRFINEHMLDNWKVFVNDNTIGWKRNFRRAISLVSGEIIFFSDQDDIWLDDKIRLMASLAQKYSIGCLYGESVKIDEDNQPIYGLNKVNHFTHRLKKITYDNSFYTAGGLGCCMCVNRRVADKYLELDVEDDDHDSQCPRIALLYDTLWHLDSPVIKYRIYPGNTSGVSSEYSFGTSNLKKRIQNIGILKKWLSVVVNDNSIGEKMRNEIRKVEKVLNIREDYLLGNERSFFSLLPYYKYYSGLTMLLGDFAYKHKINTKMGRLRWNLKKLRSRRIDN